MVNIIILEKKFCHGIKLLISGKGSFNITDSASIKEFVNLLTYSFRI
jgi:predicted flavoprotein YhiN